MTPWVPARNSCTKRADIIGRISIEGDRRIIRFDPTETSIGKNVGLAPVVFKSPETNPRTVELILIEAKEKIMASEAAKADRMAELDALRDKVACFESVEEFNDELAELVKVDRNKNASERHILNEAATRFGLEYSKEVGGFIDNTPDDASKAPF